MLQFLLAMLAGVVTIGGPCILPLLPIVLGTSTVGRHPLRPVAIVFGFTLTFTGFAVLFSIFGGALGLSPSAWRLLAATIIGLFGLLMIFPKLQAKLLSGLEPMVAKIAPKADPSKNDLWSGLVLGLSLGLVWTPCAGPVLGSILTLIAANQNLAQASALLFAFAIGAGLPMLLIAYGGQAAVTRVKSLSKYTTLIQQIFGVLVILVAIGLATQTDIYIQVYLLERYPWLFIGLNIGL
jgi:cytochrome c biogenesis protein CcdA